MKKNTEIAGDPRSFFKATYDRALLAEEQARKRVNTLAAARVIIFLTIPVCIWLWNYTGANWLGIFVLGSLIVFLLLMKRQQNAKRQRNFQRNLQTINEDETQRLDFKFKRNDNGSHFHQKAHFFSVDLDIFGDYSVYRLLNRTRTSEGSRRLAKWLKNHAPLEEILLRQDASLELKADPEFRQGWEATALLHEHAAQQIGAFREWADESLTDELSKAMKWRWWAFATVVVFVLFLADFIPGWVVLLSIGWHAIILKRFQNTIQSITNRTTALGHTLVAYSDLLHLAESAPFQSKWWLQRRTQIKGASVAFRQAGTIFARLDYRNNPFFLLFVCIPSFWDLFCLASLERWKNAHRDQLKRWLQVLADVEALNSLAGYAFANPEYPMPQVTWQHEIRIEALNLGHPLIPKDKKVTNSFEMTGTGKTILVTGSNMSGKSTFLRTLGLNIVLAQMGAVVSATRFTCSPLIVFSSMRTQDSLEENTSSFYAELKRLKQLIELASMKGEVPVFYLLDEILKGTNSTDRHKGAEALIRQLHKTQASGLVSTHDLELGEWGADETYVNNYHFRSDVKNGELVFDYQLHEGICRSFNASELMRMMGIDMDALTKRVEQ
jgi:ABC-type multidrug transport system fused ATPase/permease subunit